MSITAILTGYKRPHTLNEQLNAIQNQTIKPKEIIFCQNGNDENLDFDQSLLNKITWIKSNHNFGVWARFAYALNCKTEYVCIFDDDTIPGKKWFENCYNTIQNYNGILGTVGIKFKYTTSYFPLERKGWPEPNESVDEVDIVGHSWFFKRKWLSVFWNELPPIDQNMLVGEDIHLSYSVQKYLNLKTYVPPHPKNNMDMWGSLPDSARKYGIDKNAISNSHNIHAFTPIYVHYIKKGFKIMREREKLKCLTWIMYSAIENWIKLEEYAIKYINEYDDKQFEEYYDINQ
jgi:glycosyltransferase involved in cell wall biosynthesis